MLTKYQRTHRPTRKIERKCSGRVVDGVCVECGRFLRRSGPHLPDFDGDCGWIFVYGDGSTVTKDRNGNVE